MVTIMIVAMIKGELVVKMLKLMVLMMRAMMMSLFNANQYSLTQEFIKVFNGIIPLIISLGVFEEG
jgi:hypothetical protein